MNSQPSSRNDMPRTHVSRWLFRTKGVFMILTSIAMVVLGGYVLSKIAEQSQRNPDVVKDLPPLVAWMMTQRAYLILIALPAFICGVASMFTVRSAAAGWSLVILGTLWLFGMFAIILICFLSFLGPMYRYQEL